MILLASSLTACSMGFQSFSPSANYHLFSNASDNSGGGTGSGSGTTIGTGSGGSGSGTTVGTGSGTTTTTTPSVPVTIYCDSVDTKQAGTNAFEAGVLTLTVTNSAGQTVCSIPSAKSDIQTTGEDLNLSGCPDLPAGTYGFFLSASTSKDNLLLADTASDSNEKNLPLTNKPVNATLGTDGVWTGGIAVLWDGNPNSPIDPMTNPGSSLCEAYGASPLIIDLKATRKNPDVVDLTTIAKGVSFNILGQKAVDYGLAADAPTKISWFRNTNYGMLALPAADGRVHGIDQLVGNNSQLPDGSFKSNGYQALAFYDSNHDGVIDQKDPIFSKLRIWKTDVDSFGAPTQKLLTLKELGITEISLKFTQASGDPRRAQGNAIRNMSTVTFADGQHNMYDLWFTLKLPVPAQQRLAKK